MRGIERQVFKRQVFKGQVLQAAVCAAGVAALAALTPAAAADWQAGAGPEWADVLVAAKREGKVVVIGHPVLARPFTEEFKRDTGIELEFLGSNPREISARVEREVRAGNLTVDVVLGGGSELLTLYPEGRLLPLKPQMMLPGLTDPKNWVNGRIKWMDKEGAYFFQGSSWVHAWPVYNSDLVPKGSVRSWKDFLKPEFKGKIAAFDPRSGGPGRAAAVYLVAVFGIDFVKQLYLGQDVVYARDGRQLIEWVVRGNYAVALGGVQVDVENFTTRGIHNLVVPELADGPGSVLGGFSALKEPKGVLHPNAATVFINWYASQPGQLAYSRVMLEPSTRVDVEVPTIPDYVKPKPATPYVDQYNETWYRDIQPKYEAAIVEALGGR
jgi:ABC-type Fe3+ transport system substrate-binding protein